ncbi:MoaD/ThiS family protein [Pseudomonadales bacterium]|jgi:molybdopterin synthase sulfur carrier subunit|nr:MoaD/ThiS family protein [Pseudomonadales bacterium]MDB4450837.1 MoaD/ThiS family protein [Pseudomonadales bacterium]
MLSVKYFASLREQLGCNSDNVEFVAGETLAQLAGRLANKHAGSLSDIQQPTTRCAVNQQVVELTVVPVDGDEIAFFPPVTGG